MFGVVKCQKLVIFKPINIEFPNSKFTVVDNNDAIAILVENGLLGGFPKYEGKSEGHVSVIRHVSHPTHWLLAIRYAGFSDPADNGHVIYGFPKNQYSIGQVNDFLEAFKKCDPGSSDCVTDYPEENRN